MPVAEGHPLLHGGFSPGFPHERAEGGGSRPAGPQRSAARKHSVARMATCQAIAIALASRPRSGGNFQGMVQCLDDLFVFRDQQTGVVRGTNRFQHQLEAFEF